MMLFTILMQLLTLVNDDIRIEAVPPPEAVQGAATLLVIIILILVVIGFVVYFSRKAKP
jgi:Zn-dependent protease with chaperone function